MESQSRQPEPVSPVFLGWRQPLQLVRNQFSSFPSLIGLNLRNNYLYGSIPSHIDNNLSGVLPASIGNLSNLNYLYLYSNKLSGFIPSEIGMLEHLYTLQLPYNNLGTICFHRKPEISH
uniref:Leucine-rich repeat-containing N-terminal plant-type domain-containing protein n=1 Tax=Salix viminalis TaxID=40686 RepID=A0A6N2MAS3_SALVM